MPKEKSEIHEEDLRIEIPEEEQKRGKGTFFREPSVMTTEEAPPAEQLPVFMFTKFDFLALILIGIIGFFSVISTFNGIGFSWDEAYYYQPSIDAVGWLGAFFRNPLNALKPGIIDEYWGTIPELPALSKMLLGLSQQFLSRFLGPYRGMRIAPAIAFAATLALLYVFGFYLRGRFVASGAVLFYWLMPRVFGHAHIAGTETLANFFMLLSVGFFIKSVKKNRQFWAIATCVATGCALAIRINSILLIPLLILFAYLYWRKTAIHTMFFLIVGTPLVLVIVSPLFWHNTVERLLEFILFFVSHKQTAVYYFGTIYVPGGAPVPWDYPWIMTAITIPVMTLVFIIVGIAASFHRIKEGTTTLVLACALFPLLVSSFPGTPKYDGIRLFMPAFPFLALIGGLGLSWTVQGITSLYPKRIKPLATILASVMLLLVLINGLVAIRGIRPYYLSYYNYLIGGVNGAFNAGMEVTYWGEAVNEDVIDELNSALPQNASLKVLALHDKVFAYLQDWLILRQDIKIDGAPPYDYHLLLVRKSFFMRPERYLYENWRPQKVFTVNGVPLVALYKTGERFEKEWPRLTK